MRVDGNVELPSEMEPKNDQISKVVIHPHQLQAGYEGASWG